MSRRESSLLEWEIKKYTSTSINQILKQPDFKSVESKIVEIIVPISSEPIYDYKI